MAFLPLIESRPESARRLSLACQATSVIGASEIDNIDRVVLFGSTICGMAKKTSDADVAVIIALDEASELNLKAKQQEIVSKINNEGISTGSGSMDVHVTCWSVKQYEEARRHSTCTNLRHVSALRSVVIYGITLFQRIDPSEVWYPLDLQPTYRSSLNDFSANLPPRFS